MSRPEGRGKEVPEKEGAGNKIGKSDQNNKDSVEKRKCNGGVDYYAEKVTLEKEVATEMCLKR